MRKPRERLGGLFASDGPRSIARERGPSRIVAYDCWLTYVSGCLSKASLQLREQK